MMRQTLMLIVAALMAACGARAGSPAAAPDSVPVVPVADPVHFPVRVLVVTGGHPYDEDEFWRMWGSLEDVEIESFVLREHSELFENIDGWAHDTVVFYNMTHELSEARLANLMKLTEMGVGLIPLHHGTLSWTTQPAVKEIFGVQFPDAGPFGFHMGQQFTYHIADPNHPMTQGLADWPAIDETYTNYYGEGVAGSRVLITTDHTPSDPELVWVRHVNNARIANIQGGHDRLQFDDANYRELLRRAILWTSGRLPDEVGGEALADTTIYRETGEVPGVLAAAAAFNGGQSRKAQTRIERMLMLRLVSARKRTQLLEGLVALAGDGAASREARSWALRTAGIHAEPAQLAGISALVNDETMSRMACYALETSIQPQAAGHLVTAAATLSGAPRRKRGGLAGADAHGGCRGRAGGDAEDRRRGGPHRGGPGAGLDRRGQGP